MATLIDYKGLQVVDPEPTGDGGLAIQDDFKALVDWSPKSMWSASTDPTADDDIGDDYYPGSLWLRTDTTPPKLFVCRSNTATAAVWDPVLLNVVQDTAPKLGGNLDVNGQTIASASNGNIAIVPHGTGKVGVGTASPSYAVDVSKEATGTYVARILNTSIASNCSGLLIDTAQNSPAALTVKSSGSTKFEVSESGISVPNSNVALSSGKAVQYDTNHMYMPWNGSKGIIQIANDSLEIQNGTFASPGNVMMLNGSNNRVGIGTASPNAALDVSSTTQGFLPPRMTTTQRDAISSPAEGLVIYNLTTHKLNVYTGSAWEAITSA